jgi:hypothetical protein
VVNEEAAQRQEITRLRRRAERHRQVAMNFGFHADARAAYEEARAVERRADRMEADLTDAQGGNVLLFRVSRLK